MYIRYISDYSYKMLQDYSLQCKYYCKTSSVKEPPEKSFIRCIIPGGGYSVRKLLGVCRGPLKIGPKKIEGKMVFWGQKDRILRGFVPKRSFLCWWMRKTPQKDRARSCQSEKRGSKPRHICITHHIGSTPPQGIILPIKILRGLPCTSNNNISRYNYNPKSFALP